MWLRFRSHLRHGGRKAVHRVDAFFTAGKLLTPMQWRVDPTAGIRQSARPVRGLAGFDLQAVIQKTMFALAKNVGRQAAITDRLVAKSNAECAFIKIVNLSNAELLAIGGSGSQGGVEKENELPAIQELAYEIRDIARDALAMMEC
jgi:hypothetical protein